ncbi:MAG: AAA family ATPase, partial [Vulcanimicrobiaceae bacterium]
MRTLRSEASWVDVHEIFAKHGLEYARYRAGARISDTESPDTVTPSAVDRQLRLGEMQKRFGRYEPSPRALDRLARDEAVRRAENLVVGARLLDDPSPILAALTARSTTFIAGELSREIERRVLDERQRVELFERVGRETIVVVDGVGKQKATTREVIAEEAGLAFAADALFKLRGRAISTPPAPSPTGDVVRDAIASQQHEALSYALDGRHLSVITGVPGSGKTRLINAIASAYEAAGYHVRGVSVANSAVDVLLRETPVAAVSVAKQLANWAHPDSRDTLTDRDVLVIDEVSTLGNEQGRALLEAAAAAGARVIALGDDRQHEAVARGSTLRVLRNIDMGPVIDMATTARQQKDWQRDATQALRRGDVAGSLARYKRHGALHELETRAEAFTLLVEAWRGARLAGATSHFVALKNVDVSELNERAHRELRAMGKLSGSDHAIVTSFGSKAIACGDELVVRERLPGTTLYNGAEVRVTSVDGTTVHVRDRDGRDHAVDTAEHPMIDYAYASTSFRAQGRTDDLECVYLGRADGRRSLLVDASRHRKDVVLAYDRESVGNYQGLVKLVSRERSKDIIGEHR